MFGCYRFEVGKFNFFTREPPVFIGGTITTVSEILEYQSVLETFNKVAGTLDSKPLYLSPYKQIQCFK